MALTEKDKNLLLRCLGRKDGAWEDFVDRFTGLVVHVVVSTTSQRGASISPEDRDDLVAEVFLAIVKSDFAVLRHFRGQSSLATYLAVIARRVVVASLARRGDQPPTHTEVTTEVASTAAGPSHQAENREQVQRVLQSLDSPAREAVRLYYLENCSYREISQQLGIPVNSLGPLLARARQQAGQLWQWS